MGNFKTCLQNTSKSTNNDAPVTQVTKAATVPTKVPLSQSASVTELTYGSPALGLHLDGKLDEKDLTFEPLKKSQVAWLDQPIALSMIGEHAASNTIKEFRQLEKTKAKAMEKRFHQHNIYSDIYPFVETQILVGNPSDNKSAAVNQYINANRIRSIYNESNDENLIIAAQGPIQASMRNFWKMVHQERVGMIVTLARNIPGDCDLYFPEQRGESKQFGEMHVITVDETSSNDSFIHHRVLQVEDQKLGTSSQVDHYHFKGWTDWKLPTGNSRKDLAELVERAADFVALNARKQRGDSQGGSTDWQRLLLHCRAGIGRTGTTITLVNSVIAIKEQMAQGVADPQLSVFSIVRKLREQRIWMVQTDDQYSYLYEFLGKSKWLKAINQ